MMNMQNRIKLLVDFTGLVSVLSLMTACAHSYHFSPEIEGDGAMFGGKGVIYSIPPGQPEFQMKLLSLGVESAPASAHLPSGSKMLQIRMYFKNLTAGSLEKGAYVDPKEELLLISENSQIRPSLVHSTRKKETVIPITGNKKQLIEFFYALPNQVGAKDLQWFSMRWKIHYGNGHTEQQVTRFDRHDSAPQGTGGFPDDPAYLDMDDPGLPVGYFMDGDWWDPFY